MSDKADEKSVIIKFELPQIINAALLPLATSIGTTLSYAWEGMTMGIATWCGRKEIDKNVNLKLYSDLLKKNLSIIGEENLQEPKMNILGPAFDASKYYFEEEQYRIMFSKLIASSCDKSKNSYVHPAFVEFIKQMTPLEGKIISYLDINRPILIKVIDTSNNQRRSVANCPAILDFFDSNIYQLSTALDNLERLGLITLPNEFGLTEVPEWEEEFLQSKNYKIIEKNLNASVNFEHDYCVYPMSITDLGKSFIKVCVE